MNRKKMIILAFAVVLACAGVGLWLTAQAHRVPECLLNMDQITARVHTSTAEHGRPPTDLSSLCSSSGLPRSLFFCPADRRGWDSVRTTETFYSSYVYSPDAAISGSSNSVLLYCTHHRPVFRRINITFGDGQSRDVSVKEAKQWLPDL